MASEAFEGIVTLLRERNTFDLPLAERRIAVEQGAVAMPPPDDVTFTEVDAGGIPSEGPPSRRIPAEWVDAPGATTERIVLYLHGGAYCICSPRTHRRLTAAISREAGARLLAIDYRLAPEHPFPAAVDDALTAYRWLLEQQDPSRIAVAGDSAGGGLTVALLVRARDEGLPMPACAVPISPWADLELIADSVTAKQDVDPMLTASTLKEEADCYLAGADPRTPLASPIYADLRGLPPMLIHAASDEILLDDAIHLDARAKECGVDSMLEVWDEMIHVWHVFAGFTPESDAANRRVGEFLREHFPS